MARSWKGGLPTPRQGRGSLREIQPEEEEPVVAPGTAEIGFALLPSTWGTGLFRVAGALLCRFAFDIMKLHRLEMRVSVENTRAQVAVYKLGATPEGLLRDSYFKNGRCHDSVMFRVLRPE